MGVVLLVNAMVATWNMLGNMGELTFRNWKGNLNIKCHVKSMYPLVMTNIAVENHHFLWENPLFL